MIHVVICIFPQILDSVIMFLPDDDFFLPFVTTDAFVTSLNNHELCDKNIQEYDPFLLIDKWPF